MNHILKNLFLICGIILPVARGDLTYYTNDGQLRQHPLYSLFIWNYHFNITNVQLVNLQFNQNIFDYCDVTKYNPQGITLKPLLSICLCRF